MTPAVDPIVLDLLAAVGLASLIALVLVSGWVLLGMLLDKFAE